MGKVFTLPCTQLVVDAIFRLPVTGYTQDQFMRAGITVSKVSFCHFVSTNATINITYILHSYYRWLAENVKTIC